ncbi:MAG: hypothetical protein K5873_07120 [Treponema sp.]|nr:hypothetical protein [Treponema sp.]
MNNLELGLEFTINLSKALFSSSGIKITDYQTDAVFPIFYSPYDKNSFGHIFFTNTENNAITDGEVSLFIERFMTAPKVLANYDRVNIGEDFSADLTAFFNEGILSQLQANTSDAEISVSYKSIGKRSVFRQNISLLTLARNSMSWKDDRQCAAFISSSGDGGN